MRTMLERVDAWCRRGDFTVEDVARYRIIYGVLVLITLPGFGYIADLPDAQFDPPPGPIMVFDSIPPPLFLEGLELAIAILSAMVVLGFRTRLASVLLPLAMMTGQGLGYSFGKIDHPIIMVLAPLALAFSGWGGAMSVDAATRSRSGRPAIQVAQWPIRLFGFMIGCAFVTAGWAKLRGGWLDLDTQAVRAHFVHGYVIHDRNDLLAPKFLAVEEFRVLWEAVDWFTVALEVGLVFAVLSWRLLRIAVAFAALFHLGVFLMMNIQFSANVIGYGAFYRWNAIAPTKPGTTLPLSRTTASALALLVGAGIYMVHNETDVIPGIGMDVLILGAVLASLYLGHELLNVVRAIRRRDQVSVTSRR